ncbi:MAG: RlmE family RNA methyltransferase [Burkholderiaceae bacterium]
MGKKKTNRAWVARHLNDPYVRQAQQQNYRSRAAYKLLEIDERDRLIRPGMTIVDLGSAPGAWSQVARRRLGSREGHVDGRIVAIDLLPMEPIADVEFVQGDFRDEAMIERLDRVLGDRPVDLVLSDMAPNLSGVAVADAARMADLIELALEFSLARLTPDGALLVKCFHGSGYSQIVEAFKRNFRRVAPRKPKASRDESAETFLLGREPRRVAD